MKRIKNFLLLFSVSARKSKDSDDFQSIRCSIYVFENQRPTPAHVFEECARHYALTGKSLNDICDNNATVAWNLGRHNTATIWKMIKLLFGCSLGVGGVGETSVSGGGVSGGGVSGGGVSGGGSRPAILAANRDESETSPGDFGKDSRPGTRHQSGSNMVANADVSAFTTGGGVSSQQSNDRGDTSGGVSEEAESEVEDIDSQVLSVYFRLFHHQGPDLYAFIGFIGFICRPWWYKNYTCWTFSDNMCYILVIKY